MAKTSYFYDFYYKPFFQIIQKYIPSYIHPNLITIMSFVIITLLYVYNITNPFLLSLGFLTYWACDNLDGIHARATKQTSDIGEILDHSIDSYCLILISKMILSLLNISNPIIPKIMLYTFNIGHLVDSYTNNLELGYRYFTVDEVSVILILSPFLKDLIPLSIMNNIFIVFTIFSLVFIGIKLYKIRTQFSKDRLYPFLFMVLIDLIFSNRIIVGMINMIYVYYMIKLKKDKFNK